MRNELIERFTRYVKVNTQSNSESASCPSTPGQIDLAKMLVNDLEEIGMTEITLDDNGYVMATLPSNSNKNIPTIGFLAHLDTATEFTGNKVKPRILNDYDGEDIILNKEYNIVLSPKFSPELKNYIGHSLIVTDGTTLLGADDKAGIAEIMTAMSFLINNPDIKHGTIRVAFTPDEEIGRGPHKFDVNLFGAKYAYTVDGGPLGELQYESFNAAEAIVTFKGKNVHPGRAKNKMINSLKLAVEFNNNLPESESPENTEGYEGFYHLLSMNGDVEETKLHYIIRDHDKFKFEERKHKMIQIAEELQGKYGIDRILLKINDQYYNMRDKIEPVKEVFNIAYDAMTNLGIDPKIDPIRGGTDGSQLSYMGLPTPNLFTGGENFHGRFEYISVENMVKSTEVILEIIRLYEERG